MAVWKHYIIRWNFGFALSSIDVRIQFVALIRYWADSSEDLDITPDDPAELWAVNWLLANEFKALSLKVEQL